MNPLPAAFCNYITGLKSHDVPRIASTVADDLAFIMPAKTLSKKQFLEMLTAMYAGFPDWSYDHDPPEVREDRIAVRWRQGGTHTGMLALPGFEPVQATGRSVRIPEQFFFYRLRDGQIVEIRPEAIQGGAPWAIFEQIGATAQYQQKD
jgi:predicted ester cyclase